MNLMCLVAPSTQERKVFRILDPLAQDLGYELVQVIVESGQGVLRIMLDKESGVRVGECEAFAREARVLLDVEWQMRGRCILEVSSPGVARALTRVEDFQKFQGKRVRISYKKETLHATKNLGNTVANSSPRMRRGCPLEDSNIARKGNAEHNAASVVKGTLGGVFIESSAYDGRHNRRDASACDPNLDAEEDIEETRGAFELICDGECVRIPFEDVAYVRLDPDEAVFATLLQQKKRRKVHEERKNNSSRHREGRRHTP